MTATVQVSTKAPDGTIFVVGGANYAEFSTNLIDVVGQDAAEAKLSELAALLGPTGRQAGSFEQAAANVTNAFPDAAPEQQWRQSAPPAAAPKQGPPPGTSAPACDHGQPREWKTGTSKAGKAYKGWFCQNPNRDAQCAPSWVR